MSRLTKLVALVVVAGVCAGAFRYGYNSNSNNAQNESVPNHTVSGNILDDLSASDGFESVPKKIVHYKTNGRVINFNTDFNYHSVNRAIDQIKELNKVSAEPIFLLIHSPGGSVFDGGMLISAMEASKAPVYTVCVRLCASMAAMTHSYGSKRMQLDRSLLMYHPATGGVQGQINNAMSLLKTVVRYINKMNSNIVSRSDVTREEFERLIAYEIWIDAEDAAVKGFTDEIVALDDVEPAAVGSYDRSEGDRTGPPSPRKMDFQLISPYANELW